MTRERFRIRLPYSSGGAAVVLLAALAAGGCASPRKVVDVDSDPSRATIYVNGEKRGVTRSQVTLEFPSENEHRMLLQIVKPGYKPVFQYWYFSEVPDKKVFKLEVD